jgi:copper chaperone
MTTLSIPDMSCGHCKAAVTAALTAVPGVAAVEVDLSDRTARVGGNAPLPALLAALEQAGYPATASDTPT